MKIKAENYPVILVAAFAVGILLAMLLGFRPAYGSHDSRQHDVLPPAVLVASEYHVDVIYGW